MHPQPEKNQCITPIKGRTAGILGMNDMHVFFGITSFPGSINYLTAEVLTCTIEKNSRAGKEYASLSQASKAKLITKGGIKRSSTCFQKNIFTNLHNFEEKLKVITEYSTFGHVQSLF